MDSPKALVTQGPRLADDVPEPRRDSVEVNGDRFQKVKS